MHIMLIFMMHMFMHMIVVMHIIVMLHIDVDYCRDNANNSAYYLHYAYYCSCVFIIYIIVVMLIIVMVHIDAYVYCYDAYYYEYY